MSEHTNYLNIPELVEKLKNRTAKLELGTMQLEEVALMTEDARELYERLVILSYKTAEATLAAEAEPVLAAQEAPAAPEAVAPDPVAPVAAPEIEATPPPVMEPIPVASEPKPVAEPVVSAPEAIAVAEPAVPVHESQSDVIPEQAAAVIDENIHPPKEEDVEPVGIKFDLFEPPPTPENQVSLIDAIQEEEEARTLNDFIAESKKNETVSSQLGKSSISDLGAAIGINQKFLFMNDLFDGNNDAFREAVVALNSFANIAEAETYVNETIATKFDWNLEGTSAISFLELVERRYA